MPTTGDNGARQVHDPPEMDWESRAETVSVNQGKLNKEGQHPAFVLARAGHIKDTEVRGASDVWRNTDAAREVMTGGEVLEG